MPIMPTLKALLIDVLLCQIRDVLLMDVCLDRQNFRVLDGMAIALTVSSVF